MDLKTRPTWKLQLEPHQGTVLLVRLIPYYFPLPREMAKHSTTFMPLKLYKLNSVSISKRQR